MLTERLNLGNDIVNYSVTEKLLGANNANIKINVEIRRLKWKKLKGGPTGGETLVPQQY